VDIISQCSISILRKSIYSLQSDPVEGEKRNTTRIEFFEQPVALRFSWRTCCFFLYWFRIEWEWRLLLLKRI